VIYIHGAFFDERVGLRGQIVMPMVSEGLQPRKNFVGFENLQVSYQKHSHFYLKDCMFSLIT